VSHDHRLSKSNACFFCMKEMPKLIQFHFPNFFPDFRLRQSLGCLAHPLVSAYARDAKKFSQPAKTGLSKAIKQDRQGLGCFRAAPLWGNGKVKAAGFAAVTLESPHKTMLNIRGASTSLACKVHGVTSWMFSGGNLSQVLELLDRSAGCQPKSNHQSVNGYFCISDKHLGSLVSGTKEGWFG